MRYPGENAAGHAPGRRRSPSGQEVPPRPGQGGRSQPGGESSLFVPGYRGDRQAAAEPDGDAPRSGSRYGWAGGAAAKGPVRGFPPAPGQPPPVYPPGQFAAWNRAPWPEADSQADNGRAAEAGQAAGHADTGGAGPGYAGSGYSVLAVSDPAADVTSTQTWGAVGDGRETGAWTNLRAPAADRPPQPPQPEDAARPPVTDRDGRPTPARGHPVQADGGSGPGTQPVRARGHGTGAHSARSGPRGRTGPAGPRPAPKARRKLSRRLLAAGIAVVAVVGGGVFVLLHGLPGGQAAAAPPAKPAHRSLSPSPTPSSPTPTPSPTSSWRHIESRSADPTPLTLTEVFPASFAAGASYSRTVSRRGTNCAAAVVGGQLQHAVRRPVCSQVLRASYLSASQKLMGTIGVLNLETFTTAERAGRAAGPAEFIAQLPAAKGPTRNLTKGTGIEEPIVKGHYLILVWAEFTTLHKPKTKKQRQELEGFISQLIQHTANVSLTSRMVTGSP
jgi:hypothetical protein